MKRVTWWFDLDNTLHHASHAIFPQINRNMNAYIERVLKAQGLDHAPEQVNALRRSYLDRYGATLLGMMRHHRVDRDEFLDHAHRFDDLAALLRVERGLMRSLRALPGRKILLTNAPRQYSRTLTRAMGLHRHLHREIAIEAMQVHGRLRPKPAASLFRRLLSQERRQGGRHVLVEDTAANLRAAKRLGFATVWVTGYLKDNDSALRTRIDEGKLRKRPKFVDVKVKSVTELVHAKRHLLLSRVDQAGCP